MNSEQANLIDAATIGDVAAARRAIAAGADVNATYGNGCNVLTTAARSNYPAIVRLLIDAGANVNPPAGQSRPLYWAIFCGRPESVRMLLEAGAVVTDDDRENAKIFAASGNAMRDSSRESAAVAREAAAIARQIAAA